jgi:hypothetical protein
LPPEQGRLCGRCFASVVIDGAQGEIYAGYENE